MRTVALHMNSTGQRQRGHIVLQRLPCDHLRERDVSKSPGSVANFAIDCQKVVQNRDARRLAADIAMLLADELAVLTQTQRAVFWAAFRTNVKGDLAVTECFRCGRWPCECADGICLLNADCQVVLDQIERQGMVDLLLTDPPYGLQFSNDFRTAGQSTRAGRRIANDDSLAMLETVWPRVLPLLKDDRHWYVFGAAQPDLLMSQSAILHPKQILAWDKTNGTVGDTECTYAAAFEMIHFGMRGRRKLKKRDRTIIRVPPDRSKVHPTPKPVALCKLLMANSTERNELVFDPFCGAGATLVAAKQLGRRAIGIEIEAEYCQAAAERLRQMSLATDNATWRV